MNIDNLRNELYRRASRIRVLLTFALFLQVSIAAQAAIADPQNSVYRGVLASPSTSSAPFNYVVTILMENKGICAIIPNVDCSYSNIIASYMSSLALAGRSRKNHTAMAYQSLPNYLDLFQPAK